MKLSGESNDAVFLPQSRRSGLAMPFTKIEVNCRLFSVIAGRSLNGDILISKKFIKPQENL